MTRLDGAGVRDQTTAVNLAKRLSWPTKDRNWICSSISHHIVQEDGVMAGGHDRLNTLMITHCDICKGDIPNLGQCVYSVPIVTGRHIDKIRNQVTVVTNWQHHRHFNIQIWKDQKDWCVDLDAYWPLPHTFLQDPNWGSLDYTHKSRRFSHNQGFGNTIPCSMK